MNNTKNACFISQHIALCNTHYLSMIREKQNIGYTIDQSVLLVGFQAKQVLNKVIFVHIQNKYIDLYSSLRLPDAKKTRD